MLAWKIPSLAIATGAYLKGVLSCASWIDLASAPAALPIGTITTVTTIPFYTENILTGLMAAGLRLGSTTATNVRKHEFDKDPLINCKKCNLALGLGGALTLFDVLKEKLLEKTPEYTSTEITEDSLTSLDQLKSTLGSALFDKLDQDTKARNATRGGYTGAIMGGVLAASAQYGMINSSHYNFLGPDAENAIAIIIGIANIFTMHPNALHTPAAFTKLYASIKGGDYRQCSRQSLSLGCACCGAFSYMSGGAHLAMTGLDTIIPNTNLSLPISWLIGIITAIPIVGQSIGASDDMLTKMRTDGAFDPAKAKAYFKNNFWGMFVCALSNALPSAWFTWTSASAIGGPMLAIPLVAIAALSIIATKGPASQRFLKSCWDNEYIRACLSCGGNESLKSHIEALCCCSSSGKSITDPLLANPALDLINAVLAEGNPQAIAAIATAAASAATESTVEAGPDPIQQPPSTTSLSTTNTNPRPPSSSGGSSDSLIHYWLAIAESSAVGADKPQPHPLCHTIEGLPGADFSLN